MSLLPSLYRNVSQGVSLEAVSACVSSLSKAASAIVSGPRHAALFQIKHLLILREQLAPFQMESSLKEMTLDWSNLKDAAYGLVQKRAYLFSLNSNNALLQFIVDGTPQVTEHIMDSKRDVDKELKKVCEQLIISNTLDLIGSLMSLLSRMDKILTMNETENNVKPIVLKNQPFATPEKIGECVSQVFHDIRSRLPTLQVDLHLYLANRDTEFILLKPVRLNVLRNFSHLSSIVTANYSQDDTIIANCPSPDELNMMMNSLLEVRSQECEENDDSLSNSQTLKSVSNNIPTSNTLVHDSEDPNASSKTISIDKSSDVEALPTPITTTPATTTPATTTVSSPPSLNNGTDDTVAKYIKETDVVPSLSVTKDALSNDSNTTSVR